MSDTPLLDKLRRRPPSLPPWFLRDSPKLDQWRAHRDRALGLLADPDLAARNIDPIARHHYESTSQEYFDLSDLTLAPAAHMLQWLEYQLPERIRSEIGDQDLSDSPEMQGHAGFLVFDAPRVAVTGDEIPENAARFTAMELFLEFGLPRRVYGPHGIWVYALDAQGKILDVPSIQGYQEPAYNEHVRAMQGFFYAALLALGDTPARRAARALWETGAGKSKIVLPEKEIKLR